MNELNDLLSRLTQAEVEFVVVGGFGAILHGSSYMTRDLGPLDILSETTGVGDFDRVASRAVEVELFGQRVRVIGIEDLIAAKESLGHEKGLLAAKELRAILARS